MEKIKTKFRQFRFRLKHDYLSFDNVVFVVAIVACIFWTYSSLVATSRNWELSQKLTTKRHELELLKFEVESLEVEVAYYNSAEYKELSARMKENKILDGEHLVYLPENSKEALDKYTDKTEPKSETETPSNVSQWISFLFGV